ncbi:HdeD family acid-resistance protein [Erythrobacter sp.]|uniref:HdeD family acid-resistance protein n=1 Tax=Erythrobacter sp. TaxID=1042 RepID=UPI003C7210BB
MTDTRPDTVHTTSTDSRAATRGEPASEPASEPGQETGQEPERGNLTAAAPRDDRFARHLATHNWGWFALRGVMLVLLGIFALVFPGPTLFASALVFAAIAFADGAASIVAGIRGARNDRERWWALILSGLLGVAVGVLFLFFPFFSTMAFTFTAIVLIAGYAIATGVLQIVAAWRLRREIEGEWLLMLAGAFGVALGLVLLGMLLVAPAPTLLMLAWIIGIWALASGISLLVLAFRLRSTRDRDTAERAETPVSDHRDGRAHDERTL